MGDWLCDVVTGCYTSQPELTQTQTQTQGHGQGRTSYTQPTYPHPQSLATGGKSAPRIEHVRRTIHPSPAAAEIQDQDQDPNQNQNQNQGLESEPGMGRLMTFRTAQPLSTLIEHIAAGTGAPGGIPIAVPQRPNIPATTTTTTAPTTTAAAAAGAAGATIDDIQIRTVGVCPGSGSGVLLKGVEPIPDLLLTGEMSHHETLAAIERGSVVISLFHSNTERGFLHAVMKKALEDRVRGEWNARSRAVGDEDDSEAVVEISEADRDPYGVMIRRF